MHCILIDQGSLQKLTSECIVILAGIYDVTVTCIYY